MKVWRDPPKKTEFKMKVAKDGWSYMYMDFRYNVTRNHTVDNKTFEVQNDYANYTLIKTCIPAY